MSSPIWSGGDPWFRIGRLEVTTTIGVTLLATIATVLGAFGGWGARTVFTAQQVLSGELWRVVTWPWVDGLSAWTILTFLVFWYFGNLVERELGRQAMLRFLLEIWAMATAAHLLVGLILPGSTLLFGLGTFQFILLLLFIAEAPRRPFLFGIPAWVFGAILLGLQILQYLALGAWGALVAELVTLVGAAVVARRHGLLTDQDWIPGRPRQRRKKAERRPTAAARTPQAPAATSGRHRAPSHRRGPSDEERMDELLDKINRSGFGSLTAKERDELTRLAERRRSQSGS